MAKRDAERGAFGAWATEQRRKKLAADVAAGIERKQSVWSSADKAQPEIERLTGWRMRSDYLRGIESGNQRPGPDTIAALEQAYGSVAPPAREPNGPPADQAAVLAAIERQTELLAKQWQATTELVDRMGQFVEGLNDLVEVVREDRSRQGIDPKVVTLFLQQLASEGLLVVPGTEPTVDEAAQLPATKGRPGQRP